MDNNRRHPASAESASHQPSEARSERCSCCGRAPELEQAERSIRLLNRMTDLGMERLERHCAEDREEAEARRRVAQATGMILTPAQREVRDAGDVMYQQNTRAIRLCMALADQFMIARQEHEKQRKSRRQDHLARLVREAIAQAGDAEAESDDQNDPGHEPERRDKAEARASTEFERTARLAERLTEYDIDRDIGNICFSKLIDRLCSEMGIEAPWEIWQDQPWAQDEASLGIKGSPYARPPDPNQRRRLPPSRARSEGRNPSG